MIDISTRRLIEGQLDGSLSPREADELARLCEADPALRTTLAEEQEIRELMRRHADLSFEPNFAQRVLARLGEERDNDTLSSFAAALATLFPRVAVSSLSVAAVVMVINWKAAAGTAPLVDALLGLPSPNLDLLLLF